MMPKNFHEQFTSRNMYELANLMNAFNELNLRRQFCLYLDENGWEIFDLKVCVPVIRHEYRHIRDLIGDIRHLDRNLTTVGMWYSCYVIQDSRKIRPAVNYLKRVYGKQFYDLFPDYDNKEKNYTNNY